MTAGMAMAEDGAWRQEVMSPQGMLMDAASSPSIEVLCEEYHAVRFGRSVMNRLPQLGDTVYEHGLGVHANSLVRIHSPWPIRRFTAIAGLDANRCAFGDLGNVTFVVTAQGKDLYRSAVVDSTRTTLPIDLTLEGVKELDLIVESGSDPSYDHANWADAAIVTADGKTWYLDALPVKGRDYGLSAHPFSFTYEGVSSDVFLAGCAMEQSREQLDPDRRKQTIQWQDKASGLQVICEMIWYADYPAVEWLLSFANTGEEDTGIVADVRTMDLMFDARKPSGSAYKLYATKGGVPNPSHFEASTVDLDGGQSHVLKAASGRSSTQNFPFFKVDTGRGSIVAAVGWSGAWRADVVCPDERYLHVTAGMEKTHFLLHPGERVRSPRSLVLFWEGDTWDANARFRELVYKHYAAKRNGKTPLPIPFCNTCFTRGGGWLNECNAANQISLINAYAALGLEALLTDAGWFEGGWPYGAGNWTPRKDAYPQGMAPVAAAAKAKGMVYGLWFEPERVVTDTDLHRNHPELLLKHKDGPNHTYLLNMGHPEAREYFFNIVKEFMDLPGFAFYRQDFNMDPLPYWRYTDEEDRQGIAEMKYIEGLYAYWDRIRTTYPDSIMEECASGGHRIDLETVMRMHVHQKVDFWFDNEADQAGLWGLSQYLPNNTVVAHLNRLDDYSFRSTLASSLCLGWIADAPEFDSARGKALLNRYHEVRHLLIGGWYPLLGYSRDQDAWHAVQYHRRDLDEGLVLVFRRAECPYPRVEVSLRGIAADGMYEVSSDEKGSLGRISGKTLGEDWTVTLPDRHSSDLITYKRVSE